MEGNSGGGGYYPKGGKGKGGNNGGAWGFGNMFNTQPSAPPNSIWTELLEEKRKKDETKKEETLAHTVSKSVQDSMGAMLQAIGGKKSSSSSAAPAAGNNEWFPQTKQLRKLFAQPSETSDEPGQSGGLLQAILNAGKSSSAKKPKKKKKVSGKNKDKKEKEMKKRKRSTTSSSSTPSSSSSESDKKKKKKKDAKKKHVKNTKKDKKRKSSSPEAEPKKREIDIPNDNPKTCYAKLIQTLIKHVPDTDFEVDTSDHDEWVKIVRNATGVTGKILNLALADHSLSQTTYTDKSGKINQLIDFFAANN